MNSCKIDERYYTVNNHDVIKLYSLGGWVCDCCDWIYNKKCGELGYCKHILEVKDNIRNEILS